MATFSTASQVMYGKVTDPDPEVKKISRQTLEKEISYLKSVNSQLIKINEQKTKQVDELENLLANSITLNELRAICNPFLGGIIKSNKKEEILATIVDNLGTSDLIVE